MYAQNRQENKENKTNPSIPRPRMAVRILFILINAGFHRRQMKSGFRQQHQRLTKIKHRMSRSLENNDGMIRITIQTFALIKKSNNGLNNTNRRNLAFLMVNPASGDACFPSIITFSVFAPRSNNDIHTLERVCHRNKNNQEKVFAIPKIDPRRKYELRIKKIKQG